MPVDKFGRMSDTKTKDTGVSLTYINNNYIRSDGGTPVTGSINMNGNTIYNMPDPVNPQDVATKEYADTKTNIISVSTHYYGSLIKDKYQFTFGGNNTYPALTGFLIPHSGRIKKIVSRVEGIILVTGSLFSLFLTKKEERTQTRLADYVFELGRDIINNKERRVLPGGLNVGNPWRKKCYFDNDLENYPLSEGDLITEKDYTQEDPKPSFLFTFLIELDPL